MFWTKRYWTDYGCDTQFDVPIGRKFNKHEDGWRDWKKEKDGSCWEESGKGSHGSGGSGGGTGGHQGGGSGRGGTGGDHSKGSGGSDGGHSKGSKGSGGSDGGHSKGSKGSDGSHGKGSHGKGSHGKGSNGSHGQGSGSGSCGSHADDYLCGGHPPHDCDTGDCIEVLENTVLVTDLDSGPREDQVVYKLFGGPDADLFTVSADGVVEFVNAPDFEAPKDEGGDNTYEITVRVIDTENPCRSRDEDLQICVQDEDDPLPGPNAAPQIIAPGNPVIPLNKAKMGQVVVDVDAIDPDSGPEAITYAISGEDADFFQFDTETGQIRTPADIQLVEVIRYGKHEVIKPLVESADGDWTFEVTVTASDGADTDAIELQLPLFLAG